MLEESLFDVTDLAGESYHMPADLSDAAGRFRPVAAKKRDRFDLDEPNEPKKRKRVLACPLCKMLRHDGSMVSDGQACNGGHITIDNSRKVWRCLQCDRSLSINGSWVTTAKRHFDDDGKCVVASQSGKPPNNRQPALLPAASATAEPVMALLPSLLPSTPQLDPPNEEAAAPLVAADGFLRCCECGEAAEFQCNSCSGSRYCSKCDSHIHTNSFNFLRGHERSPLGGENKDGTPLQCFPACGECHTDQIVRLGKEDSRVPLFPATDNSKAKFELTMKVDSMSVPLPDLFWSNRRSVTVRLPSFSSLMGANHGPHRTQCEITLRETQQGVDPALTWVYTYEHSQLLDQIVMLEALNGSLKDLVTLAAKGAVP